MPRLPLPSAGNPRATSSRRSVVSRRDLLRLASVGVLGWSWPQWLAIEAAAATSGRARAKNVLVLLEQGGLSHIDTWDPKPDVTAEHRSPHKPISTSVPGMQFTELLAHTSRLADKLAVVRSMHHTLGGADGHPKGTQYVLSGAHPSSPTEMPDIGSVVTHLLGSQCRYLPPSIMVPGNDEQAKETRTGFLPAANKVFKTGGLDLSDSDWRVADLVPADDNGGNRLKARRGLLGKIDAQFSAAGSSQRDLDGMDRFYEQAFDVLTSPRVSSAFDLHAEPLAMREKYGRGHRGACYLLGRKLIESGVRFVTVDVRWPLKPDLAGGTNLNWDHHDFIYAPGTCNLPGAGGGGRGRRGIGTWEMMGSTDQALAALIDDLDQRGLLDETLVCFVTEFGRTPRINAFQGRDHWTRGYSIALAGAGVPGGQVIGSTDKDGGDVASPAFTPEDYGATIYEKLGIDRSKPLYTPTNRPIFFGHLGEPIAQLF